MIRHKLHSLATKYVKYAGLEWLNEQRMIEAREILKSEKSIKETSADLGFKQTTHFHREYKRVHGVTPSIFKRHTAVAGRK